MDEGFIKLHRKFFSNELWKEARIFSSCEAWLDLIQSTRFEAAPLTTNVGGREIVCQRGQYPASIRFLAKKWGWKERRVRTFLEYLKKRGMASIECTQGMNVITLCKYEEYNSSRTATGMLKDTDIRKEINELHSLVTQLTTQQTAQCRHTDDTKKKKEEERKNMNISSIPPKEKKKIDLHFVDSGFLDVFTEWIGYKQERGEQYKSEKSLKICYTKLLSLSNNDPDKAYAIIEQSIASNYSGFFKLEENGKSNSKNRYERKRDDSQQRKLITLSTMERIREEAAERRRELEKKGSLPQIS